MQLRTTPITQQADLIAFCRAAAQEPYITVDTEFVRESTYWPQLCLVQVGTSEEAVAIDPLAEGLDLEPLFDLMDHPKVLKIFHAARQDLEIFHHLSGKVPSPLFDTQIAAMVCGFGENIGYEGLVRALLDASVDKSSRYTNWAARPLTSKQIDYALGDVTHLREAYKILAQSIAEKDRMHWLDEEMAILASADTYIVDERNLWRKLKPRSDKPRFLAILRELAAVREIEARRRDVPRGRVIKDDTLLEIASHPPSDKQALAGIRGVDSRRALGEFGEALLNAIKVGTELDPANAPTLPKRQPKLSESVSTQAELLRVLLNYQCQEFGVAPKLIANSDDLKSLAAGKREDLAALAGWRAEIFGHAALKLLKGEMAILIEGDRVVCRPL